MAKAKKPFEPDREHLFCAACGTRNAIQPHPQGGPALRPCSKCGGAIAGALDLLNALGLYAMESRGCPTCGRDIAINRFCFVCGHEFE